MEDVLLQVRSNPVSDKPKWQDWLRLSLTPHIGLQTQHRLVTVFGSAAAVFEQSTLSLETQVSEAQARALQQFPPDWDDVLQRTKAWLNQSTAAGVEQAIWTWDHENYPRSLRELDDPPLLLFAQGQVHQPCWQAVAVVGSRNPTPQGKENAKAFAAQLQLAGCCIVSGLAMGIDAAAHIGALQNADGHRCATVAVVGTGLDQVYPRHHHALAQQVAQRGWLLSEFAPGTPPLPHHFPRRNRLIAGLSLGVLVVEAAMKSGSLITADLAASQGKEVFAIPGSIHSVLSRGCHALLRQGAKLVESAADVMEELPLFNALQSPMLSQQLHKPVTDPLQKTLLKAMGSDPVSLEMLLLRGGFSLEDALAGLQALADAGRVAHMPGGLYQQIANSTE
jgi:DNA processing protein